jgi:rhodanese-related sulfurtransferase
VSSVWDDQGELAPDRVAELAREGAQVVDVRLAEEHAAGHIEGSLHIELDRLAGTAHAIDSDRPVVFYCRSGARSALATEAFRAAGYEAFNLSGGLLAWAGRGLPLAPRDGRVA